MIIAFRFSVVVALVAACGTSHGPPEDAAMPDAHELSGCQPGLPPCPAGWSETLVENEGRYMAVCDPWPGGMTELCEPGFMQLPGQPGCVPIGSPCSGQFAAGLPSDERVVYVDPTATGGDGTREAPFGEIAMALATLGGEGTVALARGTYDERVTLAEPVRLWGACAAETVMAPGPTAPESPIVDVAGARVELVDLTVAPSWATGIATSARETILDGVAVVANPDAPRTGISVSGGGLELRGSLIANGEVGLAVRAGRVTMSESAVENHRLVGIQLESGSTLLLSESVVANQTGPEARAGIAITDASSATIERTVVQNVRGISVLVSDPGSEAQLAEVLVSDSLECVSAPCAADVPGGIGVAATSGGRIDAYRFHLTRHSLCSILLADDGEMDLSTGLVSAGRIGACILVDGYDLARLTDRVCFVGVVTDLETTELPEPSPSP